MIFDYGKPLVLNQKDDILNEIKKLKNNKQNCVIIYNEYLIKKENILKFALLMMRANFVDDMFYSDYSQEILRALFDINSIDSYSFLGHIFKTKEIADFCYVVGHEDGNFYIQKTLCYEEEIDLVNCFESVKKHIHSALEFVNNYTVVQCLFDEEPLSQFKNKFKNFNQN